MITTIVNVDKAVLTYQVSSCLSFNFYAYVTRRCRQTHYVFVRSFVRLFVRPFVPSFVRTDLVTTISHERLEQSR